ncbi:recombinase family protein [Candidatus Jidaibacter acanthamoebae]|nr:recombinase family protein [Candidatus Jidaibacter acanthamoeba]
MQMQALENYVAARKLETVLKIEDIDSRANIRAKRELLLKASKRREIDMIIVWRLDRWGRSVTDLIGTLKELNDLGVGFISITQALDLTTATGQAMAGLLAIFAEFEHELLKERVKADIAHARKLGKPHGRPKTVANKTSQIQQLFQQGLSKSQIAKTLNICRTSVRCLLALSSKKMSFLGKIQSDPLLSANKVQIKFYIINNRRSIC